jgi:hypothetical protein
MDVQPMVNAGKPPAPRRKVIRRALVVAAVFALVALVFLWVQFPTDPDADTRVDGSVGCFSDEWLFPGVIGFFIGVIAGLALLIWGGVREARRRDRTGLALMLAGVIGLVMAGAAVGYIDAVDEAIRWSCD